MDWWLASYTLDAFELLLGVILYALFYVGERMNLKQFATLETGKKPGASHLEVSLGRLMEKRRGDLLPSVNDPRSDCKMRRSRFLLEGCGCCSNTPGRFML